MSYIITLVFIFSVSLFGCGSGKEKKVSEEEQRTRLQNAFDISGAYQTTTDSSFHFRFTITNQNEKNDISVTIDRTVRLTDKEKTLLSNLKKSHGISDFEINDSDTFNWFGQTLGDYYLDSGGNYIVSSLEAVKEDNISTDLGKTSKFEVCSRGHTYDSRKTNVDKQNIKLRIYYCFSGLVKRENRKMVEGHLTLKASSTYDLGGGLVGWNDEGSVDFNYKAVRN